MLIVIKNDSCQINTCCNLLYLNFETCLFQGCFMVFLPCHTLGRCEPVAQLNTSSSFQEDVFFPYSQISTSLLTFVINIKKLLKEGCGGNTSQILDQIRTQLLRLAPSVIRAFILQILPLPLPKTLLRNSLTQFLLKMQDCNLLTTDSRILSFKCGKEVGINVSNFRMPSSMVSSDADLPKKLHKIETKTLPDNSQLRVC